VQRDVGDLFLTMVCRCHCASAATGGPAYRFVCVDEARFAKTEPTTFESLARGFTAYQ
jgi:hypothetical protein